MSHKSPARSPESTPAPSSVPPHDNAEPHRQLVRKLSQMSERQILEVSVRAGVHNKDGTLTKRYRAEDWESVMGVFARIKEINVGSPGPPPHAPKGPVLASYLAQDYRIRELIGEKLTGIAVGKYLKQYIGANVGGMRLRVRDGAQRQRYYYVE